MHRRDRITSGSSVSSVVSSFTRKSKESAKENIPSKLPRGPAAPKEYVSRNKDVGNSYISKTRDHVNQNGSTGSRSEQSSASSRRTSTASSVSSQDGEPASPVFQAGSTLGTNNNDNGKVASPKVNLFT